MNTITATELRNNLDGVMKKVTTGQELVLTHRFYGSIKLTPLTTSSNAKRLAGLELFEASPKLNSNRSKSLPIKKLYHESLKAKYLK